MSKNLSLILTHDCPVWQGFRRFFVKYFLIEGEIGVILLLLHLNDEPICGTITDMEE